MCSIIKQLSGIISHASGVTTTKMFVVADSKIAMSFLVSQTLVFNLF